PTYDPELPQRPGPVCRLCQQPPRSPLLPGKAAPEIGPYRLPDFHADTVMPEGGGRGERSGISYAGPDRCGADPRLSEHVIPARGGAYHAGTEARQLAEFFALPPATGTRA